MKITIEKVDGGYIVDYTGCQHRDGRLVQPDERELLMIQEVAKELFGYSVKAERR